MVPSSPRSVALRGCIQEKKSLLAQLNVGEVKMVAWSVMDEWLAWYTRKVNTVNQAQDALEAYLLSSARAKVGKQLLPGCDTQCVCHLLLAVKVLTWWW